MNFIFGNKIGHFYPIFDQKLLIHLVLEFHIRNFSEFLHDGRGIQVNKGGSYEYAQKAPGGPKTGHSYPKMSTKTLHLILRSHSTDFLNILQGDSTL